MTGNDSNKIKSQAEGQTVYNNESKKEINGVTNFDSSFYNL